MAIEKTVDGRTPEMKINEILERLDKLEKVVNEIERLDIVKRFNELARLVHKKT